MMDPIVHEYYELVKRYCSLVEGLIISRDLIEELMSILLQLYEKALHLPNLEVKDVAVKSFEGVLPLKMEIPDYYWQVFNLFNEEEEDKLCGGVLRAPVLEGFEELQSVVFVVQFNDLLPGGNREPGVVKLFVVDVNVLITVLARRGAAWELIPSCSAVHIPSYMAR